MKDIQQNSITYHHIPVLVKEVIENSGIKPGSIIIDCNFGGGGHASEFIKQNCIVYGIDYDNASITQGENKYSEYIRASKLTLIQDNFKNIDKIADNFNLNGKIDLIFFDLGLSTYQIKTSKKGFSFADEAELDMRADPTLGINASDLIKVLNRQQLEQVLREYGDVAHAKEISVYLKKYALEHEKIIAKNLAEEIALKFNKNKNIHPATLIFQALRILVNNEIENLIIALNKSIKLLNINGRLMVITFHSLEERTLFAAIKQHPNMIKINKDPVKASFEELKSNISSRSAKLFVYEKKPDKY